MTGIRTTVATLLTGVALFIGAGKVQAEPFEHIEKLAYSLQGQARKLSREFKGHYSHTAEYRHLAGDTSKMYKLARHIHGLAHEGEFEHMSDDLRDLDKLFHHIEETVDEIEHEAEHGHGGHVHGNSSHVRRIMGQMEDTLHHLEEDIEELSGHEHHDHEGEDDHDHEPAPGVEFKGGKVRLRFGF